jgi:predicted ATPase
VELTVLFRTPDPTALALLANVVHSLGYPEQALGRMHRAVAQARELSHPYTLAWVLGSAAWLHWERREKLAAQDFWKEQAALCTKHGFKALLASASLRLGFADVESGRAEDGLSKMLDALANCLTADKIHSLGWLALAEGKAGRIDQGLARIDEALKPTKKRHGYWLTFLFNLIKGQLVLMKNPNALRTAKQCFSIAIESARNQNAKSDELTAAIQMTRVLMQQGRRDQARLMLKKIYSWFTEGFDTGDLKEAKALLDALSH